MTDNTDTKQAQDLRKEYTLKSPVGAPEGSALLIQAGVKKFAGDKVRLRDAQVERLRATGIL